MIFFIFLIVPYHNCAGPVPGHYRYYYVYYYKSLIRRNSTRSLLAKLLLDLQQESFFDETFL